MTGLFHRDEAHVPFGSGWAPWGDRTQARASCNGLHTQAEEPVRQVFCCLRRREDCVSSWGGCRVCQRVVEPGDRTV